MNVVCIPRRFAPGDWGGTETVIVETGKRLLAMGHGVEIMCPDALSTAGPDSFEGIPVTRFPYFYPYLGLSSEARRRLDHKGGNLFSFALMRALREHPRMDVAHLHTGKRLGGIVRTVARSRGVPYVVTLHGGVHDVPAGEASTWTEPTRGTLEWGKALGLWVGSRRVLEDADALICVGRPERDLTQERFPDKRVVYLPNGVDAKRFQGGDGDGFRRSHGIPDDSRVVLVVGRIDPQKDQRFAVGFLQRIAGETPAAHLLIVGPVTNDRYMGLLKADVRDAGLDGRVTIIPGFEAGSRELVDAYDAADVFLLPSRHEPFGIVILEAWSAGLPVLCSSAGGVPAFVEDGRDGLMFEPGDIEGCMRGWHALADDPGLCGLLASSGREKARTRYSWERVTSALADLYSEVVEAKAKGG